MPTQTPEAAKAPERSNKENTYPIPGKMRDLSEKTSAPEGETYSGILENPHMQNA